MLSETAQRPVGQGLRYPSFPETAPGNKIKQITVRCDYIEKNLTRVEKGCVFFEGHLLVLS